LWGGERECGRGGGQVCYVMRLCITSLYEVGVLGGVV
jgi:hypothetical protein